MTPPPETCCNCRHWRTHVAWPACTSTASANWGCYTEPTVTCGNYQPAPWIAEAKDKEDEASYAD